MIVMIGNGYRVSFRELLKRPDMGVLLTPIKFQYPRSERYACDNDCFANRHDPDWWAREGELRWLKMLDKLADHFYRPLFCVLPDVVGDWEQTLERAMRYLPECQSRQLEAAIAFQDGCDGEAQYRQVDRLGVNAVFVGGSVAWKWRNVERLRERFWREWLHVGRVNGPRRIRECLRISVDSCDGTGFARHSRRMLPPLLRELDGKCPQIRMAL